MIDVFKFQHVVCEIYVVSSALIINNLTKSLHMGYNQLSFGMISPLLKMYYIVLFSWMKSQMCYVHIVNAASVCEEKHQCGPGQWKCSKCYECIDEAKLCDASDDCIGGSDEENCETYPCLNGYVKCGDLTTCILVSMQTIS